MFKSPFRHDTYEASRPKVTSLCRAQYIDYLRRIHPEDSLESIERFVDVTMKEDFRNPDIDLIRHPSPGNTIREVVPLTKHLSRDVKNRIVSPSGSVYYLPTEKESFLRITIARKKAERSKFKKVMLAHKEEGNTLQASIANYLQSNAKITNNSFAGALNSPYNILYDKANFASTTSISRQSVKCGYSLIELFLGGNHLFFHYDDVVSYSLRQIQALDLNLIQSCVTTYQLYIPTAEDLFEYFKHSIRHYMLKPPYDKLRAFSETLSPYERCAVFYSNCFKNLVFFNDSLFRSLFDDMFDVSHVKPNLTDKPESVYKRDDDIVMMVQSLHADVFGTVDGRQRTLNRALSEFPEGVSMFLGICDHYEAKIAAMEPILSTFLRTNTDLPALHRHQEMVRTNTLISDTDSAIFTTQNFVEWYSGKLAFDRKSFAINAFTVFSVVKALQHRFARLSCGFGMVGKDIYGINMKNEFFMAVLIRTNIKKHYASLNMYQEGKILPEPKVDIKGVQFRDSKLGAETNKRVADYIKMLFNDVQSKGTITGSDYLQKVKDFERRVFESVMDGERTFLKTEPIKSASEYKNDAMSTSYFYYDFWSNVFVPEFDGIIIPNKCYVLPLKGDGSILKDLGWQDRLLKEYPDCHRKLLAYLKQCDETKKKITRIVLPPSMGRIPEIFLPLIDIRSIIFTNCQPLYLVLKSIGFAYNFAPDKFLISDFFKSDEGYSIPYC